MTSPAATTDDILDRLASPAPIEAAALLGLRALGFLGVPFALLQFLFLHIEAWQVSIPSALLLIGCIGLCLSQRWAAVLVCGLSWFPLATYVCDPFPGDPSRTFSLDELAFAAINGGVAILLTALPPLCSRWLKHGLWTRPAMHRPVAVVAVLTGFAWLGFHLHALVEWESKEQAMARIGALTITIAAALLALLWRRRSC